MVFLIILVWFLARSVDGRNLGRTELEETTSIRNLTLLEKPDIISTLFDSNTTEHGPTSLITSISTEVLKSQVEPNVTASTDAAVSRTLSNVTISKNSSLTDNQMSSISTEVLKNQVEPNVTASTDAAVSRTLSNVTISKNASLTDNQMSSISTEVLKNQVEPNVTASTDAAVSRTLSNVTISKNASLTDNQMSSISTEVLKTQVVPNVTASTDAAVSRTLSNVTISKNASLTDNQMSSISTEVLKTQVVPNITASPDAAVSRSLPNETSKKMAPPLKILEEIKKLPPSFEYRNISRNGENVTVLFYFNPNGKNFRMISSIGLPRVPLDMMVDWMEAAISSGEDVRTVPPRKLNQILLRNCGKAAQSFLRIDEDRWLPAFISQHPWHVTLFSRGGRSYPFCGGSIISSRHVLTAAHCIVRDDGTKLRSEDMDVMAGQHDPYSDEPPVAARDVAGVFVHEFFDPASMKNDIALLVVHPVFALIFHRIWPVCLPRLDMSVPWCTISGHGNHIDHQPENEIEMRHALVQMESQEMCKLEYTDLVNVSNAMFCAAVRAGENRDNACVGDSGGPLSCRIDNKHYLYGITSRGRLCTEYDVGLYTKVLSYVEWIGQTIEITEGSRTEYHLGVDEDTD